MTDVKAFTDSLPEYDITLHITHNQHKSYYEEISTYLARDQEINPDGYDLDEWVSREDFDAAISLNSLWEVQWYPNTPVGFCITKGSTLENALKKANEPEE